MFRMELLRIEENPAFWICYNKKRMEGDYDPLGRIRL